MCSKEYCPCKASIDPVLYGDRAGEFHQLSLTGKVTRFYEDCYLPLLENGTLTKLNKYFLTLLEEFEIKHRCGGICSTNLFWFFESAKKGPPNHRCKNEVIQKYDRQCGSVGIYCLTHAAIMILYFLNTLLFCPKYGSPVDSK